MKGFGTSPLFKPLRHSQYSTITPPGNRDSHYLCAIKNIFLKKRTIYIGGLFYKDRPMAEDRTPKPDGWAFALMKDAEGNYTVAKLKLKGKQVQSYEVIHPETSRGDAKRQLKTAIAHFCFTYGD